MRVRVDEARCQGHGVCNMTAPEVFDLSDEDGHVVLRHPGVIPPELEDAAARGVECCPELALRIEQG